MDNQKLYDKINQLPSVLGWKNCGAKVMVAKESVMELVRQLEEPQKVVVPKFVAEHIEYLRGINSPMRDLYNIDWIDNNQLGQWLYNEPGADDLLGRAWLDGYEVEQEKLYTVEILGASLFKAISDNHVRFEMVDKYHITSVSSPYTYISKLTEKEIKSVDERLWQFAKEVG